jgi:phosphoenolpyruvate synthase/pyruvate phosphate dikinase
MTDSIRLFQELDVHSVDVAGGKGANLGELTRAGLPVPPGFVITAQAYLAAMDQGGVREQLRTEAAGLDHEDVAGLDLAAAHLQELVHKAGCPTSCAPTSSRPTTAWETASMWPSGPPPPPRTRRVRRSPA